MKTGFKIRLSHQYAAAVRQLIILRIVFMRVLESLTSEKVIIWSDIDFSSQSCIKSVALLL